MNGGPKDVPWFIYAEGQQDAILREVHTAGSVPASWMPGIMLRLQKAANEYLEYKPHYLPPAQRAAAARARAREAKKFRMMVARAEADPTDPWRGFISELDRAKFMDFLDRLECLAELDADATAKTGGPGRPESNYFTEIFNVWVSAGGGFRRSRNSKTGVPDGPFVRFIQAVTRPVMGKKAPTPETIYTIIRRQEALYRDAGYAIDENRFITSSPKKGKEKYVYNVVKVRGSARDH